MPYVLIILLGICLLLFNVKALRKDKKGFSDVLSHEKNSVSKDDIEIGKLRMEFSETVQDMQHEIEDLKEKIEELEERYDKKTEDTNPIGENKTIPQVSKIREMFNSGKTPEEISKELDISKGEVLLIKSLYIK